MESSYILESILNNISIGVLLSDEKRKILFINTKACEIIKISKKEALNKEYDEIIKLKLGNISEEENETDTFLINFENEEIPIEINYSSTENKQIITLINDTSNQMDIKKEMILRNSIENILINYSSKLINADLLKVDLILNKFLGEILKIIDFEGFVFYNFENQVKMKKSLFKINEKYNFEDTFFEDILYLKDVEWFVEKIENMKTIYMNTEDLKIWEAKKEYEMLIEKGIENFMFIPIGTEKENIGFILFFSKNKDISRYYNIFNLIEMTGKVVTNVFFKRNLEESLFEGSNRLMEFMSKLKEIYNVEIDSYDLDIDEIMKKYIKISEKIFSADYSAIIKFKIGNIITKENFNTCENIKIVKSENLIIKDSENILLKVIEKSNINQEYYILEEENKDITENEDIKTSFWVPIYVEGLFLGVFLIFYSNESNKDNYSFNGEDYLLFENIARGIGRFFEIERKTEQLIKSKEAAEEANRIKSMFLATMSHEIRTPMNSILGFSDLLYEEETDIKRKELLRIIKYSAKNLMELINDILDISKIESGKLEVNNEQIITRKIFKELYLIFLDAKKKKNLNFVYTISENVPDIILSDELRLKQIVINLLSNAFKFTEKGSIKIYVDYYNEEYMTISVEDTGIGIAKENIGKIFDTFSQEDSSTSRKYGGTGLGLTISQRLAKMLNGSISLKSEKGKGSVFTVKIKAPEIKEKDKNILGELMINRWISDPELEEIFYLALSNLRDKFEEIKNYINDKNKEKIIFTSHKIAGTYGNLGMSDIYNIMKSINEEILKKNTDYDYINYKIIEFENLLSLIPEKYLEKKEHNKIYENNNFNNKYKILLAEDSEYNQLLIKKFLAKLNMDCHVVENGQDALAELEKNDYDILLLDRHMPYMSGEEVLININNNPKIKNIKKIILTADAQEEVKKNFFRLGCDDYLSKPIEKKKFFDVINNIVKDIDMTREKNIDKNNDENIKSLISLLEKNIYMFDPDNLREILENMDKNISNYNFIKAKLENIIENFDDEGLEELIKNIIRDDKNE